MDVLSLSRLQFAVTAAFHFIFVPLTLGLSVLVALMETRSLRTADPMDLRKTKFWGKLFLINFVLGVVTGITMEFQFGMNWAEYSRYVGDVFGAPLAIEATAAFFLESTFIGLWVFGWNRVSKKVHALAIWLVAIGANLSALLILLANGWMQRPVGYALRNNRAEMTDFGALVSNSFGWVNFAHSVLSGFVLSAFFVMGVSAYHLLRKNEVPLFRSSFRTAATFGLVSTIFVAASGDLSALQVAKYQPAKLAAMESLWETRSGAPLTLFVWPDARNERNSLESVPIPEALSLLAFHTRDAEVQGLSSFPRDERPPVLPVFFSFRLMVGLGLLLILLAFIGWLKAVRGRLERSPRFLKVMLLSIPLSYVAVQVGWLVTEMGRQPWIVYGLMKTSAGLSVSLRPSQVVTSLIGFTIIYGLLAVVDIYLLVGFSRRGPDDDVSGLTGSARLKET